MYYKYKQQGGIIMNITIREMKPEEKQEVKKIGIKAFKGGIEKFFVPRPKDALVALIDDKIVGAFLCKFYNLGGKKIGYVDYLFIDPDYHGKGVGKNLLEEGLDYMWSCGCDGLSTTVKDDNVGSWSLFVKNGFTRVSFKEMIQHLGLGGAIKHYFTTTFAIAVGMEYYLVLKDTDISSPKDDTGNSTVKENTAMQITAYVLVNLLLVMAGFIGGVENAHYLIGGYAVIFVGMVFSGFIGSRFSKEIWHFRFNDGGALISFLLNLSGFFPMIGNWYPKKYRRGEDFKRALGFTAFTQWCYILFLSILPLIGFTIYPIIDTASKNASYLLLYLVFAFYPFESFGGGRVWRWNKWVYMIMTILSLISIFFLKSI